MFKCKLGSIKNHMPFNLLGLLFVFIVPLLAFFILESFSNGSISETLSQIRNYPIKFILNYVLMFGIINLFYVLPKRSYLVITTILIFTFSCLGFISYQKLKIKGEPLLPSDFRLVREAFSISGNFKNVFIGIGILLIITIALISLIFKHISKERKQNYRIVVFTCAFLVVFSFYYFFTPIQNAFALQLISYSPSLNYDQNGTMLGFLMNAQYQKISRPDNYQKDTISNIVNNNKSSYPVNADFKPNIIFVMSEAFWDPTLLKNVTFSQDPIPFFHFLQKTQTSGSMLSAVYGGGTANTEFEALTGLSTQFLPGGSIAYQYVNRPIEALPTILSKQGYAASAIHTYDNWFYSRDKVYQLEGFSKFISKEFLNHPQYKGPYVRDTELTQQILNQLKETDKPDFIYSVSMEGHGPYDTTEDSENILKATSTKNLPLQSQAILDNYANRVSDVDKSLQQLINGLKQINQPTMVIFYGDHLPMLGDNYSVYKDADFIQNGNTYQDYLNLHSVPFVTWNNFSTTVNHNLKLSANFMGTFALQLAQKSGSPVTDLLAKLMKNGSEIIISKDYWNDAKINVNAFNDYELLQYDLLFGKEYSYELEPDHKPPQNTNYIQGDALPVISNVSFSGNSLVIAGNNFVENCKVYLNDKEVKTSYSNPHELMIDSPNKFKNATLQVKITDSRNKVISKSNVYRDSLSQ